MKLTIGETAKLTGISVRTLHYYDEIGLLKPAAVTDAGYRFYDDPALERLQQILFYRELSFSLKEIAPLLDLPKPQRMQALQRHKELLLLKQQQLSDLLLLVNNTIGGYGSMKKNDLHLADLQAAKEKYAEEARAKYGESVAYKQSQQRETSRTATEALAVNEEAADLFARFAQANQNGVQPDSAEANALVVLWQAHITRHHYDCSRKILSCLGQMYVADERFTATLDAYGTGTAAFMSKAIEAYCK